MRKLKAENIVKVYRTVSEDIVAVRDASLHVDAGEMVILMGPSGSGKTTLLSIAGCILQPDQGRLAVNGESIIWNESVLPAYRRRFFGFIAQKFNLLSSLTVQENVEVPLILSGLPAHERRPRVAEVLQTVSLAHRREYPVSVLSGGEKQRVAIARSIVANPPILLGDEPTANLDSAAATQIIKTLRQLATERGKSILLVTHDERYLPYADRVYKMEDGRLS